jgi:hypothetical protein
VGLITLVVRASWLLARRRLRARRESASPREMAPGLKRAIRDPVGFRDAVQLYGYRMPAIRVDSAEAWHYHFQWTPEIEADASRLLSAGAPGAMADEKPGAMADEKPGAMADEKQHEPAGREDRVDMEEAGPAPASTPSTF